MLKNETSRRNSIEQRNHEFASPLALLVGISVFSAASVVGLICEVRPETALLRAAGSAGVCAGLTWISVVVAKWVIDDAFNSTEQQ